MMREKHHENMPFDFEKGYGAMCTYAGGRQRQRDKGSSCICVDLSVCMQSRGESAEMYSIEPSTEKEKHDKKCIEHLIASVMKNEGENPCAESTAVVEGGDRLRGTTREATHGAT